MDENMERDGVIMSIYTFRKSKQNQQTEVTSGYW